MITSLLTSLTLSALLTCTHASSQACSANMDTAQVPLRTELAQGIHSEDNVSKRNMASVWSWFNWYSPKKPANTYSYTNWDQNPDSRQIAKIKDQLFFIDTNSRIFVRNLENDRVSHVKGASKVAEILNYNETLVARRNNGQIFLRLADEGGSFDWYEIGNSAMSILTDGDSLYALLRNGEIWVYKGEVGEQRIVLTPVMMPNGNGGFIVTLVPQVYGRDIAFEKTEIKNVESMYKDAEGRITLLIKDGTTRSGLRQP